MQKTIALFGGSGQTGQQFLDQALNAGYSIRALARTPEKITQQSNKLTIVKGDILNFHHVAETVENADIVVSLFGQVKGSPKDLQTNGTRNIIAAMRQHDVKRIISLSGGGLPYPEEDQPKLVDKMIRTIMKIVVPNVLNDAIAHHKVLENSGKEWVIVRAPRLTNQPAKGYYRVGWVGVNASTKIGRADLADFILKQVEDESFNYQMPFVSY